MRLGLVGYGVGGRLFHAPYIQAAEDVELVGVVTTDPTRRAQVAEDLPGMPMYDSLTALLAAGVDAVTITTPPQTRRDLVLEALSAGAHVVADKPFAPSATAARDLAQAARDAGRLLAVFHNRRWDTDMEEGAGSCSGRTQSLSGRTRSLSGRTRSLSGRGRGLSGRGRGPVRSRAGRRGRGRGT